MPTQGVGDWLLMIGKTYVKGKEEKKAAKYFYHIF
jgi:hypothetical protein